MDILLPLDFKDFLKLLNDKEVEYLLIGGYAVAYHGYPRATNDIDVWIAINPSNAERIVSALREFGFDSQDLSTHLFLTENRIIRMGMPPMRIEIATTISGVNFEECYKERITGEINGVLVPIISLKHLKRNKLASGRFKDLNDLENLP
jgi:predicted nucleotidyltransferase